MSVGLVLLGALGALLTVYLAKDVVIPELRPLVDIDDKIKEATLQREHIAATRGEIDRAQGILKQEPAVPEEYVRRLQSVIDTSEREINAERVRLATLERDIGRSQFLSRALGFVFYIALGGVFGALLAGRVEVEGFTGNLPDYFESMLIGATWTTYLAAIGFRSGQNRAEGRLKEVRQETAKQIDEFAHEITEGVTRRLNVPRKRAQGESESPAPDTADEIVATQLERVKRAVERNFDVASALIHRDMRGVL